MNLKAFVVSAGLAIGLHAIPSHAANILVVLSDANHLDLKDGKVYETGFYLNELMQPVKAFIDAGNDVTFATPTGKAPSVDKGSLDKSYFGDDETALKESQAFIDKLQLLSADKSPVISLSRVEQIGYDRFDVVYVPGGHAPMQDLVSSPELGKLLRHFHAKGKITALECHGPIALLSALPQASAFVQSMEKGTAKAQPQWIYAGYKMTVFSDREEEKAVPLLMNGADMKFYPQAALAKAGGNMQVNPTLFHPKVVEDRELITGQNPASAPLLAQTVLKRLQQAKQ